MAFTEAQRVSLRTFLGYPDTFTGQDTSLEAAFDVVGTRPATQAAVEDLLARLARIESSLDEAVDNAGLKRAEDIAWYPDGAEFDSKCDAGRRHCARLSVIFNVPIMNDAFGQVGYSSEDQPHTASGGLFGMG